MADAVAADDHRLLDAVLATITSSPLHDHDDLIVWSHRFAVRVQVHLKSHGSDVAEPVGRCIDAALSASANGRSFKPWSHPPWSGFASAPHSNVPAIACHPSSTVITSSASSESAKSAVQPPPIHEPKTPSPPPPYRATNPIMKTTPIKAACLLICSLHDAPLHMNLSWLAWCPSRVC